ncbi:MULTISPECIES: restriction endonuclease subunit S [Pseudomonas]|uniref:Restriction modification system DNA specificity subunit n=1 Tax=Pseudomonas fragi TaxID=296 RepID=A0A449IMC7_PSEFR|nr:MULTISPECIES: restriction endonuclease subunit S [Pseudomonas]AGE28274.1 restriction modification system DNA specificity subunit [Pseudomonas poae RE*1-1-14]VFB20572.1 restriction modification system DNA specificity subunit [Pseudomonas fragi]
MSWSSCQLDDLLSCVIDYRGKTPPKTDSGIRLITAKVIKKGRVINDGAQEYIDPSMYGEVMRRGVPVKNDILITTEAPLGELALWNSEEQIALAQRVILLRPDPDKIDPNYLFYYLQSAAFQAQLHANSTGTTVPGIKNPVLRSLFVKYPHRLETQRKIGIFLARYDAFMEANRRRIALLEESARLLYREWFINLRFPGFELVKRTEGIPEGWSRERLDSALLLQRGFDLPNGVRKPGSIPIYASAGINGYHCEAKVKGPGVVTGRSGTLGLVHYVPCDFWPLNTSLWVKEFRRVTPLFAYFMLSEMNLAQYNSGASVPSLDRKVVHPVEILIPPGRVIGQFDEYVGPLFEQVEYLREANLQAADARDALLPQLMSGAIRV